MKLLLLTIVVCFAAALAAPADKQKRDILPGDPRYGTEHHHHHEHENEVQISKAAGGYVGSYTVPDDTEDHSFQVQPHSSYGLPSHEPGKPLGTDFFATSDADKTPVLVPSTSYGIPDTAQVLNSYLGPVVDEKKPEVIKTTIQEQPTFDTLHVEKTAIPEAQHEVQQPAVVHKHVETNSQTLPQVKATTSHVSTGTQGLVHHSLPSFTSAVNSFPNYASYSSYSNIPVKTVDHHVQVQVPQPYHVPVTKHVTVPIPVPHAVAVPKPYYVRVPQPVQVAVDRPYAVEVPRAVPYPIPHYIRTNLPIAHHHVTLDTKANPFQTFFDNSQSTFQNLLANVPSIPTFDGFQNPFQGINIPFIPDNLPSLPSIPSIPFLPQPSQTTPPISTSSIHTDSVTVDNPALKTETIIKPAVLPHPIKVQHTQSAYKPSTACAGCTVTSASSKQEYVQPTDVNGGYVY